MLISLSLRHFGKHVSLDHDFTPGLNLVVGDNWSGKSTVKRGVEYALYGAAATSVRSEDLEHWDGGKMSVVLSFMADGRLLTVERSPRKALLTEHGNEKPLASGQSAVTAEVESLVGPAKVFLAYQTARASEISELLSLGSTKLAQHVEALLGTDIIDVVLERIRSRRSTLQTLSEAQTTEWAERLLQLKAGLGEHRDALARHEQSRAELERELLSLTALEAACQTRAEELRRAVAQAEHARQQQALLSQRIEAATRELAELDTVLEAIPHVDLQGAYENLQAWTEHQRKLEELRRAEEGLRKQVADANMSLAWFDRVESEEYIAIRVADLDRLKEEQNKAEVAVGMAKAAVEGLQRGAAGAVCGMCKRPFEGHDPVQLAAELANAEQEKREALAVLERLRDSVKAAEEGLRAAQADRASRTQWQEYAARVAAQLQETEWELGLLPEVDQGQLDALSHAYQEQSAKQGERHAALQRAEVVAAELARARAELHELPEAGLADPYLLASAEQDARTASENRSACQVSLSEQQAAVRHLTQQIGLMERDLGTIQEKLAGAEQQRKKVALYDKLAKYLRANRDRFTASAWEQILAHASQFAFEASGGAITGLTRDESGAFLYVENGRRCRIGPASDLQVAILGVGLKLALAASVASPFEVLLFDEISAAANDENALRLTQTLAASGQQILLVSHREADAAVAASVLAL